MSDEKEKMREWVNNWKETGKLLEKLRREAIRKTVTLEVLPVFDDALESALFLQKPRLTSGFVQMYQVLEKSKCKN